MNVNAAARRPAWSRLFGMLITLGWAVSMVTVGQPVVAAEDPGPADQLLEKTRETLDDARTAIESGRPADAARAVRLASEQLADLADRGRDVSASDLKTLVEASETLAFELTFDGFSIPVPTARDLLARRSDRIREVRSRRPDRSGTPPSDDNESPPAMIDPSAVRFSVSIAGVLVAECGRCHGADGGGAGGLSMTTFADLADSGVIEPGNGGESLLVRKLVGVNIDGQRMPRGRPPLSDAVIDTIRQWIDEGAALDLSDGSAPLETIASEGRSRSLSHDQLRELRFAAATALWKRGIVDEDGEVDRRETLCVVGNLPTERLAGLADLAEDVEARVMKAVSVEPPLVKGGLAVFVFAQGYDFSNFWQNVIGRERPRGMMGSSGVDGDVVYAAVALDADEQNQRAALAAEMTAAALRARSAAEWFAEGAGRSLAGRLVPDAPVTSTWQDAELAARSTLGRPGTSGAEAQFADFFTASSSDEQVAISAAMLTALDRNGRLLKSLVTQLDEGKDFEPAFRAVYRTTPEDALRQWVSAGIPAGTRR
jgi:hypothetical protein